MLVNHGKLGKNHGTIVVFPQSFHISSHVFPMISPPCDHHAMRMAQGTVDMATLALDYWDDSQESEVVGAQFLQELWVVWYITITIVLVNIC